MRSETIDVGGPVHVADFGGTGPTFVLVHGLGGSHANWLAAGERLAARGRVLAPDLAGFGRTPAAGRATSLEGNHLLLAKILDRLAGGPAILVGSSMGGMLAIMQAARRPHAVAGLVLVDPSLPRPRGAPFDRQVFGVFATYMLPWVGERSLRARDARLSPEEAVMEVLRLCCVDAARVPRATVEAMAQNARDRRALPDAHASFLAAARSVVVAGARAGKAQAMMDAVRAPTLLVHGREDRLVPVASAQAAAARRPDWTLEILDDVGHVPHMEAPDRFLAAVDRWLEGPGRAALEAATLPPARRAG